MTSYISLNTDKSIHKILQLNDAIYSYQPTAICLQDTPSNNNNNTIDFLKTLAPKYAIECSDNENQITLINSTTHQITNNSTYNTPNTTILYTEITEIQKHTKTNVFNVYLRPKTTHEQLKDTLAFLTQTAKGSQAGISKTIVTGDFNATSTLWAPINIILNKNYTRQTSNHYEQTKKNRGRLIETWLKQTKLKCINDTSKGPTFSHNKTEKAYVDATFIGNKLLRTFKAFNLIRPTQDNKGHATTILTFRSPGQQPIKLETTHSIKYDHINKDHFIQLNEETKNTIMHWHNLPRDKTITKMNNITNSTLECLIATQKSVTISKIRAKKNRHTKPSLNNHKAQRIISKIHKNETKLNTLKRMLKNTKITTNTLRPSTSNKTKTDQIRRHVNNTTETKKQISTTKQKIAKQKKKLIANIQKDMVTQKSKLKNDLWNITQTCNREIHDETLINSTEQQINNTTINKIADEKFPQIARNSPKRLNDILHNQTNPSQQDQLYFLPSDEELELAIKEVRNKKHTGPFGLKFQTFNAAMPHIKDIIKTICKMSFKTNTMPDKCQHTIGRLIPKKQPGKYRIVHVATPLAGLIEQIARHRLEYRLEANNLYNTRQYAFMAQRGRHDLISRALETIIKYQHKTTNPKTTIISLDIDGAFDNVDQDKLVQQLLDQLGPDPIKYWLSNFILHRKIYVKTSNATSTIRTICKGVPQGSSLGPILWNLVINRLDTNLNEPGQLEILSYADDIMLISNDTSRDNKLQQTLNTITQRLAQLRLTVNAAKSSAICIQTKTCKTSQSQPGTPTTFTINQEQIPYEKTMRILGVYINDKLKLDHSTTELITNEKVLLNVSRLSKIQDLDLIHSHQQWNTLIDSYILSIIIHNNLPILAIDKSARDRADKQIIKCAKIIFKWSDNNSDKAIRTILGISKCETLVKRGISRRINTEHRAGYEMLYKIMNQTPMNQLGPIQDIPDNIPRRYFNPTKTLKSHDQITINPDSTNPFREPIWLVLEGKKVATANETLLERILQTRQAVHANYSTSYFNCLSLIWDMITTTTTTTSNKNLALSSSSGIYQALTNLNQHDHRIIDLREKMLDKNWQLYPIHKEDTRFMKQKVSILYGFNGYKDEPSYMTYNNSQTNPDHYNQQRPGQQDAQDMFDAFRHEFDTIQTTPPKLLYKPNLTDYKERNHYNKNYIAAVKHEKHLNLTSFMKLLTNDIEAWSNITPSWISNTQIMALSGLTTNNTTNQITNGATYPEQIIPAGGACNCIRATTDGENAFDDRKPARNSPNQDRFNLHVTLHRAFNCPHQYSTATTNPIIQTIKLANEESRANNNNPTSRTAISNTLKHIRHKQRLIRLLSEAAFNKQQTNPATNT